MPTVQAKIFLLKKWTNFKDRVHIQKLMKCSLNFTILTKLTTQPLIEKSSLPLNYLIFNFKKQFKLGYKLLPISKTWTASIGVVLKVLKILEKRERKLEKSRSLFLSYVLRYLVKSTHLSYLACKYFTLTLILFLRKFNFFKKVNVQNLVFYISAHPLTLKRVRRIKRRLKKRLLKYENTF